MSAAIAAGVVTAGIGAYAASKKSSAGSSPAGSPGGSGSAPGASAGGGGSGNVFNAGSVFGDVNNSAASKGGSGGTASYAQNDPNAPAVTQAPAGGFGLSATVLWIISGAGLVLALFGIIFTFGRKKN